MASGSSSRPGSGPRSFDFASDDILCSYEDHSNQDYSNGSHSHPSISNNDVQKSRNSRSSVFPTTNVYSQPEDSLNSELVERTMKKYADNLMRFLEGISSRLSQLELYCYNLDKSMGEMRSDLVRDHGDADSKLKSLEKHLQEVNRSVQILRDKHELAETQKELAKVQLAQKESSPASHDERSAVFAAESKMIDVPDAPNTQLAVALPNQVAPQSSNATVQHQTVAPPPPSPSQNTQVPPYYVPSNQFPNPQAATQPSYLPNDPSYRAPQLIPQGSQPPHTHAQQLPQYQCQWSQPQSQQTPMQQQTQMRPPTPPQSTAYLPYMGGQPANLPPLETMASSMPMQVSFSGMPPQGMSHAEAMPYGYGVDNSSSPMKAGFPSSGSHPPIFSGGPFMSYDSEGSRPHQASTARYSQGGFPPSNQSLPTPSPSNSNAIMIRGPGPQQFARNHSYNELIDKLVNMGYRGDHVVSVIQRLEESGQPVDFNAVLDRLNVHFSGGYHQGGW